MLMSLMPTRLNFSIMSSWIITTGTPVRSWIPANSSTAAQQFRDRHPARIRQWDRATGDLVKNGYEPNKDGPGVKCYGDDGDGSGYLSAYGSYWKGHAAETRLDWTMGLIVQGGVYPSLSEVDYAAAMLSPARCTTATPCASKRRTMTSR